MSRPNLDTQNLLYIGRLAVYRSMWAVLRELYQPTVAERVPGMKPDPSDITKGIDSVSHSDIEATLIKNLGPAFDRGYYLVSEESACNRVPRPNGGTLGHEDEELIVFVDPVDFTMAAARGLDGSILLSFYHREEGMLASVVGDIFKRRIYCAAKGSSPYYQEVIFEKDPRFPASLGTKRRLGAEDTILAPEVIQLHTSGKDKLEKLAINVFLSKPDRLVRTVDAGKNLWEKKITIETEEGSKKEEAAVDEIYTVGGSLGPIRVADGTWDASLEFVKGFRLWDFAPGALIASLTEACVIELESGKKFDFKFALTDDDLRKEGMTLIQRLSDIKRLDKDRRKFIVAATETLAQQIRMLLID